MNQSRALACGLLIRMLVLLPSVTSVSVPLALAQDYPSRPITMIVPLVSGGGPDVLASWPTG